MNTTTQGNDFSPFLFSQGYFSKGSSNAYSLSKGRKTESCLQGWRTLPKQYQVTSKAEIPQAPHSLSLRDTVWLFCVKKTFPTSNTPPFLSFRQGSKPTSSWFLEGERRGQVAAPALPWPWCLSDAMAETACICGCHQGQFLVEPAASTWSQKHLHPI